MSSGPVGRPPGPKKKAAQAAAAAPDPATLLLQDLIPKKPDEKPDEPLLSRLSEIIQVTISSNPPPEGHTQEWYLSVLEECKRAVKEKVPGNSDRESVVNEVVAAVKTRRSLEQLRMTSDELVGLVRDAERAALRAARSIQEWRKLVGENSWRAMEEFQTVNKAAEALYKNFLDQHVRRHGVGSPAVAAAREAMLVDTTIGEKERLRLRVLLERQPPKEEPKLTGQALDALIKKQPGVAADLGAKISKAVKRKAGVMGGGWNISQSTRRENPYAREAALGALFGGRA